jgi:hypothetical protein
MRYLSIRHSLYLSALFFLIAQNAFAFEEPYSGFLGNGFVVTYPNVPQAPQPQVSIPTPPEAPAPPSSPEIPVPPMYDFEPTVPVLPKLEIHDFIPAPKLNLEVVGYIPGPKLELTITERIKPDQTITPIQPFISLVPAKPIAPDPVIPRVPPVLMDFPVLEDDSVDTPEIPAPSVTEITPPTRPTTPQTPATQVFHTNESYEDQGSVSFFSRLFVFLQTTSSFFTRIFFQQ